jgi:hypothetical protein
MIPEITLELGSTGGVTFPPSSKFTLIQEGAVKIIENSITPRSIFFIRVLFIVLFISGLV